MRAPTFKDLLKFGVLSIRERIRLYARWERWRARRNYLAGQEELLGQHFDEREARAKAKAERNHQKVTRMHARWHFRQAVKDKNHVAVVNQAVSAELGGLFILRGIGAKITPIPASSDLRIERAS